MDLDRDVEHVRAMRKLCAAIVGRNDLIGTDFAEVDVQRVNQEFMQNSAGVQIQFTISNHALGKLKIDDYEEIYDFLELSG